MSGIDHFSPSLLVQGINVSCLDRCSIFLTGLTASDLNPLLSPPHRAIRVSLLEPVRSYVSSAQNLPWLPLTGRKSQHPHRLTYTTHPSSFPVQPRHGGAALTATLPSPCFLGSWLFLSPSPGTCCFLCLEHMQGMLPHLFHSLLKCHLLSLTLWGCAGPALRAVSPLCLPMALTAIWQTLWLTSWGPYSPLLLPLVCQLPGGGARTPACFVHGSQCLEQYQVSQ